LVEQYEDIEDDGEELEPEDPIGDDDIDAAVNEFIEETSGRFHRLHNRYGTKDQTEQEPYRLSKTVEVDDGEHTDEEDLFNKQKLLMDDFEDRAEANKDVWDVPGSDSEDEKKWDCETILTTHTNTDNHPGLIKNQAIVVKANRVGDIAKQIKA